MARKKESSLETSEKVFPTRLRELMEERRINQQQLADSIGVRRQTISNYTNGQSSPDWETLVKIAQLFHVSSDYLLGLSNAATDDRNERFVCEYTGLSSDAVEKLHQFAFLNIEDHYFDSFITQVYARFMHHLLNLGQTVDDVKEALEKCIGSRHERQQIIYAYLNLRMSLFNFSELCRKIPNMLFNSDKLYDALEEMVTNLPDNEDEKELESFLLKLSGFYSEMENTNSETIEDVKSS